MTAAPRLEVRNVSKRFSGIVALDDVSLQVNAGEILCLLGDNGAGKSTLIKILSGVYPPDNGQLLVDGVLTRFTSPLDARQQGIATVFQDLSMMPLMPVVRNFVLGQEPTRGRHVFRRVDWKQAERTTREELERVGIRLRDMQQPVGTLSGGQRQSVAIARAMYFGASVLILDEPTSALGVKEARLVLELMHKARSQGIAIVFVSHNVTHAFALGDRYTVLRHGANFADLRRGECARDELLDLMAGGEHLADLNFDDEEGPELVHTVESGFQDKTKIRGEDDQFERRP